jgi:GNAT superfamily N-acetyltransferase
MIPIEIRTLKKDELKKIYQIDRSEEIDQMYQITDEKLESYQCEVSILSENRFWDDHFEVWESAIQGGAIAFGAFDGDALAGFALLQYPVETKTGQLIALYVNSDHRLSGIAKSLFMEIQDAAKRIGLKQLLVSATPSHSSVKFYLSQGFALDATGSAKGAEQEPGDIPMRKIL